MDEKMDFLIKSAVSADQKLSDLHSKLCENTRRITIVENDVGSMQKDMLRLKSQVNRHEQQSRSLQIRVTNIQASPDESVAKLVYDKVIRPILLVAKDKGRLTAVPQLANVIVDAYRMRSRSGQAPSDYPPHIMVRLTTAALKSTIFSFKKEGLPLAQPADRPLGLKRPNIMEDLTPDTYRFLKAIKTDPRFERAWTVEGQIRFIVSGDRSNSVRRVVSVYDSLELLLQ